jgi:3-(3-hydroxy-phenyl)propionate hydroxylase
VVFMGDAAHQVSPFGARGANGGVQTVENLAWKISRILKNEAPYSLLETYNTERQHGADENILNSTSATDFITPKNPISRVFRDETLRLAKDNPFARTLVNSGRLSMPCSYKNSPLTSADKSPFAGSLFSGSVAKDAPITVNGEEAWLLSQLGNCFVAMIKVDKENRAETIRELTALRDIKDLKVLLLSENAVPPELQEAAGTLCVSAIDSKGLISDRYDLQAGNAYLFRPDQIICARWKKFTAAHINQAKKKALGFSLENAK